MWWIQELFASVVELLNRALNAGAIASMTTINVGLFLFSFHRDSNCMDYGSLVFLL